MGKLKFLDEQEYEQSVVEDSCVKADSLLSTVSAPANPCSAEECLKEEEEETVLIPQLDGHAESSVSDDDDEEDEDSDLDTEEEDELDNVGEDIGPPCSDDDVSDEEEGDIFDTENVVVCQYDKISRSRNRWKFTLKNGIMNLHGQDFVFSKAQGEVDW